MLSQSYVHMLSQSYLQENPGNKMALNYSLINWSHLVLFIGFVYAFTYISFITVGFEFHIENYFLKKIFLTLEARRSDFMLIVASPIHVFFICWYIFPSTFEIDLHCFWYRFHMWFLLIYIRDNASTTTLL